MPTLNMDFETYSGADLKKVGLSRYAKHPTTEVLMCAYSLDGAEPQIWVPVEGQRMPLDLKKSLYDDETTIRAWNAQFEKAILRDVLGYDLPIERFRCTMALAYSLALPASLGACGAVVGLSADKLKDKEGGALIKLFCVPRKPTKTKPHIRADRTTDPEKWQRFKDYCLRDVVSEQAIYRRLKKWDMEDSEQATWFLDQRINEAGIPMNVEMVRKAQTLVEKIIQDRLRRMSSATGTENPNSTAQILRWLTKNGYPYSDLKKGHIEKAAEDKSLSKEVRQVLRWRLIVSKASVKKYKEILASVDDDGNLRYCFQYAGASRTGRWGGRRFQPQNLPRPAKKFEKVQEEIARLIEVCEPEDFEELFTDSMEALSSAVRLSAQAGHGYEFVDADLSAIENVVLGHVCGEEKILDTFRAGRDPYLDFARFTTGKTYEVLYAEWKAGDKTTRQDNKPPVLGCGFQLGVGKQFEDPRTGEITGTGLIGYALNMGIKLSPDQAEHAVDTWRETYSEVVKFWKTIEKAAKRCVQTGKDSVAGEIVFKMSGPFMQMWLPSGRALHYCRPAVKLVKTKHGMKEQLTYQGVADNKKWCEIMTYGGKLVENAVQAIARDLLVLGMKRADRKGLDIRLHVHDQILARVKQGTGAANLKLLIDCMKRPPKWAPDLPLNAAGGHGKYFTKD